ncbi:hypothetical protein LPY66_18695 [Dehalobacter sp. DCM]|nr:hypothetical protein LPY66_18695 [Dehalobacter sp. DCM]
MSNKYITEKCGGSSFYAFHGIRAIRPSQAGNKKTPLIPCKGRKVFAVPP